MSKKIIALSVLLLAISSCGFQPMKNQGAIKVGSISIAESVPSSIKDKLKILQNDRSNNLGLIIENYELKERKIYGGNALRALEAEIKGEIEIIISNGENTINKKLVIVKNYSVNELNPLSERETIRKLEQVIQTQLIDQIILEVRLLEM
tara:strand:- start:331 stop:780 length:450 start_codon:yes stop_codon:yes gene_type:complete